jgi:hypothetical protein
MYQYSQINGQILAPVCIIQLQNPSINLLEPIKCNVIVDSGAAMTCIPQAKIDLLGNLIESYKAMRTADNRISNRTTYFIDIRLGNRDYKKIEVFATPKEHGLLGRDIINHHKVSLNAPVKTWGMDCEITCSYQNQINS